MLILSCSCSCSCYSSCYSSCSSSSIFAYFYSFVYKVCELLKDSQFLNPGATEAQVRTPLLVCFRIKSVFKKFCFRITFTLEFKNNENNNNDNYYEKNNKITCL